MLGRFLFFVVGGFVFVAGIPFYVFSNLLEPDAPKEHVLSDVHVPYDPVRFNRCKLKTCRGKPFKRAKCEERLDWAQCEAKGF